MEAKVSSQNQAADLHTRRGITSRTATLFSPQLRASLEPYLVVAGLYAALSLYYTRVSGLQLLSAAFLAGVAFYWSRALQTRPMTLADLKVSHRHMGRQVLAGLVLAVFGWVFFSLYTYLSRGSWLPLGYGGSPAVILSITSVALAEEIFFRGYLQNRLRGRFRLFARLLVVTLALGLYKNIVHMWTGMPLILHVELFAISALLSLVTSLLLEWSDNLTGPIVLHVAWDLMVYGHLAAIPFWVF